MPSSSPFRAVRALTRLSALLTLCFILLFGLAPSSVQRLNAAPILYQAGPTCAAQAREALERASTACSGSALGRNQACYGNALIDVELRPDVEPDTITFASTGDVASLLSFQRISTAPYQVDTGEWGIALIKAQANLPDSLPGQNATFLLYGDSTLTSPLPTLRAFSIETRVGSVLCEALPDSALIIQTPENQQIALNINGADVILGSTAHITASQDDDMIVRLLEGSGVVTAFGESRLLVPGTEVWMPLGGENGTTVIDAPGSIRPLDMNAVNDLPLDLLDRDIEMPTIRFTAAESTATPTANGACTVRQDWGFTYVIQPGDTLSSIAGRAGITLQALTEGNCIQDAARILAGQTLRTPVQVSAPPRVTGGTATATRPNQAAATSTPTSTPQSQAQPVTAFLRANSTQIVLGQCVDLSWGVNATGEISYSNLNGLPVPLNGNRQECPETNTTYVFIMAFTDGRASNASVTVNVLTPED
ncbi:MAG: LysM domain-containing protein [bacterium]|nr:LysM domain-containing protein [bacterium]